MTQTTETGGGSGPPTWRTFPRRLLARLIPAIPFASGIVAALVGLYLYNALNPPAQPLTVKQVNTVVAEAMASATPPAAFSAQVYSVIRPSLVLIETGSSDSSATPGAPGRNGSGGSSQGADEFDGLGSGVVISEKGEILTAYHVIDGAKRIRVTFADGTETTAEVTASHPEMDIAVLQPAELPEFAVPAVMGNPNAMRVGDEAYAVGNPFGLYSSMSAGVISGFDRSFRAQNGGRSLQGLIQIDSAVNPGNSGGPLLNRYGQVVGIVVGILNPTEQEVFVGIGFAVPITTAAGAAGAPAY